MKPLRYQFFLAYIHHQQVEDFQFLELKADNQNCEE